MHYKWWQKPEKKKKRKVLRLLLCWLRAFFGISCLRLGIPGLRLGLRILSLEDHIFDSKVVLRLVGLGRRLDLLTLAIPCRDLSISKRGLNRGGLLKGRRGSTTGGRGSQMSTRK